MDSIVVDNEDEYLDHDSLSDESSPKDHLVNGNDPEDPDFTSTNGHRKGSYTLDQSPDMSTRINDRNLTQPIYVRTDLHATSNDQQKTRPSRAQKTIMSQSLYERSSMSVPRNNSSQSSSAKQREERLRQVKEELERKQMLKISVQSESERITQSVLRRKESESLRKLEEFKRKATERQKIVEERRARLTKAEEARRKSLLCKLINQPGKKPSPQSSSTIMTMSCFGGFVSARNRPGNKEVVHSRFLNTRPVSSTGKIIGFGSSTPRPICEGTFKSSTDSKKIPESVLAKCELLSRPASSRMSDKMNHSVISPQSANHAPKKPLRQASYNEKVHSTKSPKQSGMTASVNEVPSKIKPKTTSANKTVLRADSSIKEESPRTTRLSKKTVDAKRLLISLDRSSSASSNKTKRSDEDSSSKKILQSKSSTLPRVTRKTNADLQLDSDSIEEEVSKATKQNKPPQSIMIQRSNSVRNDVRHKVRINDIPQVSTNDDSSSQAAESRVAHTTKEISESEYKAKLMENRRLVREKREREREELMMKEREKRHADEIAAREIMELERDKYKYVEENHQTTSNDDAAEGTAEEPEVVRAPRKEEVVHLTEIPEFPQIICEEPSQQAVPLDNKDERKKKLDLIMSRIRRTAEESSSEGGISPRRAMSPEPAELDPDTTTVGSVPAFRSSLLQSMMTKGRLAKTPSPNKEIQEPCIVEDAQATIPSSTSLILSSVRESIEDSESINSPSSVIVGIPCTDDTFAQAILNMAREDCDGKEDSISMDENKEDEHYQRILGMKALDNTMLTSYVPSSADTEEEEVIKGSFNEHSVHNPWSTNSVIKEG